MENVLSLADKELIVSSFLKIAVGETVETAHHFLQATNWIIEDAMEQFYVGDTTHNAVVSSYIPPVGYTPLLSDHNHSELKEHLLNVNVGRGDGVDTRSSLPVARGDIHYDVAIDGCATVVPPIMEFDSFAAPPAAFATTVSASAPASARPKRRTPAEMDAAGPIEMAATALLSEVQHLCFVCALPTTRKRQLTSASARPTARRKKRTRDEVTMATTTLSSEGDHLCFASALPVTCARQQTSVEITPAVFSFGAACMVDASAPTTGRRKKRTNAEMDAVTQSSTAALLMPGIIPTVASQQEQAHAEGHIPLRVHPMPSSNNDAETSRCTISEPVDSTHCRRSKRLRGLQQNCPIQHEQRDAVLLVFAYKQDLPNAMTVAEITAELALHSLKQHHWYIQITNMQHDRQDAVVQVRLQTGSSKCYECS